MEDNDAPQPHQEPLDQVNNNAELTAAIFGNIGAIVDVLKNQPLNLSVEELRALKRFTSRVYDQTGVESLVQNEAVQRPVPPSNAELLLEPWTFSPPPSVASTETASRPKRFNGNGNSSGAANDYKYIVHDKAIDTSGPIYEETTTRNACARSFLLQRRRET